MALVAGVDSSTQSTKVVLYDEDTGAAVAAGAAPHPPTSPPVSEQHPDAWWTALGTALRASAEAGDVRLDEVRAISVAAQCHGLIALDAGGRVLRPAKLWNDTTSAPQMRRLLAALPAADWARRVGSVPTAAFTVSKLAWLEEHERDVYDATATILLPHDWLTWRLTGARVTDRSEASGTGYFDATRDVYDLDVLALVDPGRTWQPLLPDVLGPGTAAGEVTDEAARELGLRAGTLVGPGAGDQHASALGLGVGPGDVCFSFGTSGVVFTTQVDPVFDATGMVDGVADATGGYLPLVSTLNAARVTDVFAGWLGVDHAELSRLALAAPTTGLPVLLAYLDGERKPDLPTATGALSGLTTGTTRAHLARAAVEGVVFGLLRGEQALRSAGASTTGRVLATGGAARSAAYPQLLADLSDRVVHLSSAREAVAAGAAIQAAACLRGQDVTAVRDAWAAETHVGAEPRQDVGRLERFEQYLAASRRLEESCR